MFCLSDHVMHIVLPARPNLSELCYIRDLEGVNLTAQNEVDRVSDLGGAGEPLRSVYSVLNVDRTPRGNAWGLKTLRSILSAIPLILGRTFHTARTLVLASLCGPIFPTEDICYLTLCVRRHTRRSRGVFRRDGPFRRIQPG